MKQKLGVAMMAAPFVGLAAFLIADSGLAAMLIVFGGSAAVIAWIAVAVHLMESAQ